MHLLALMIGILLLPEASSLKCYQCPMGDLGTCTTTTECPQGQRCAATRHITYTGGYKFADENSKQCSMVGDCVDASVNYGVFQEKRITRCCTTPLCNNQPVPEPSKSPNGKQCYYCDEPTCTNTNILNCEGNEDSCFSLTVTQEGVNVTMKGCVTKHICTTRDKSWARGMTISSLSCCEGKLCNSASSRSAGLVLLAAPLLSLLGISY